MQTFSRPHRVPRPSPLVQQLLMLFQFHERQYAVHVDDHNHTAVFCGGIGESRTISQREFVLIDPKKVARLTTFTALENYLQQEFPAGKQLDSVEARNRFPWLQSNRHMHVKHREARGLTPFTPPGGFTEIVQYYERPVAAPTSKAIEDVVVRCARRHGTRHCFLFDSRGHQLADICLQFLDFTQFAERKYGPAEDEASWGKMYADVRFVLLRDETSRKLILVQLQIAQA